MKALAGLLLVLSLVCLMTSCCPCMKQDKGEDKPQEETAQPQE